MNSRTKGVRVHARAGYLPGELALYDRTKATGFVHAFAELRGLDRRESDARVANLALRWVSISRGGSRTSRTATSRRSG